MKQYLDTASAATLAFTLVLFVVALFFKGLSHEMLLEAGVFLVSVKLVISAHKNELSELDFMARLNRIDDALSRLEARAYPGTELCVDGTRHGGRNIQAVDEAASTLPGTANTKTPSSLAPSNT